jgi:UDP-GlcNAc:undecaprenyl-phosphate GlcNAc-1-phosphate transferase
MLDNMDGISTLTSLFIFLIAALYIALHNDLKSPDFIILLGLIASLFAFLFFNWSPSKMYMGDTGSQFLGIILAYIGIKFFWNSTLLNGENGFSQQVWVFLIGFLLPIADTTIVSLNRILRGQSPFIGGRDHTTHNLVYFGLSDSQVALSFAAISMINLFLCFFIFRFIEEWTMILSILCGLYCFSIFASLLYLCIKQRDKYSDSPE